MSKINKFGTFGGVFVPSILTILGVIMYLRLPSIIGEAGLYMTLGIILIAHVISITTGLSVSSIATDKKVEAGGTYYMISRSLGLPIGGTLGLALFVGLSFSVSLYLIGFAESFLGYWDFEVNINSIRIAGTAILVLVTVITFISTSLAIKTQYFIMAAIFLSLISIVLGSHGFVPEAPHLSAPATGFSFMVLFGIFFPAVTGFEAGVSMSGDLKDAKKSIPGGTIAAILVGLVVYVLLAFFFAFTVDRTILSGDPEVLLKISSVPDLVIAGIWGATLSSALGSILGAPRILQATAVDKITPRFFAKGVGKANEPRNALMLTFLIAEAGILIGELDVIARIVSIFFITTYGFLNLSCAFEAWTSADFRPSFKTPVWVSLLGAAACILVMIQLDFIATLAASLLLGLLYFYLKRKELSLASGDAWSGVWASLVKSGLKKLTSENLQSRNWRPNLLVFAAPDQRSAYLTQLGLAITGKLGLLSVIELVEAKTASTTKINQEQKTNGSAPSYFKHRYQCGDVYHAMGEIANIYGFSGIEPNTILMGWSQKKERKADFIHLIRGFEQRNLNSLFFHFDPIRKTGEGKTIDIWWSGWGRNLSLALSLLKHITTSEPWQQARVRLLIIQNEAGEVDRIYQQVQRILANYRVSVKVKVHNNFTDQYSRSEIIATESGKTDLTIVGIPDAHYDDLEKTYEFVSEVGQKLGTCLFINASTGFEEYNIILEETTFPDEDVAVESNWILPPLELSKYPEVAEDIQKIDTYNQTVLRVFVEKTFKEYFRIDQKLYKNLNDLVSHTAKLVTRAASIEHPYKRSELMARNRRHFIDHAKKYLIEHQLSGIEAKAEAINTGLSWYLDQLGKDVNKFPKRLTIQYHKDEFKFAQNDTPSMRMFKLRKRLAHPFAKKTIPVSIRYREVAGHFLRDNRFHFLNILFADFNHACDGSLQQLSTFISYCEGNFERHSHKLDEDPGIITMFSASMVERMEHLIERNKKLYRVYEGRILLEFRKNLSQMAHYMERIRVNSDLLKKRRTPTVYAAQKEKLQNFSAIWKENHVLAVNNVVSNTHLLNYLGYLGKELQQFKIRLSQWLVRESKEPVDNIKNTLIKLQQGPVEKRQPIIPAWNVNISRLLDDFELTSDRLASLAKSLPDEIDVKAEGEDEALTVPLNSLVTHLVEIRLTGPYYDYLEELQDKLMQSSLLIQDQANLSIFNLYNADADDRDNYAKELMGPLLSSIASEERKMSALADESLEKLNLLLSELRDSLHIATLTSHVGEFSQLIRKHRGQQMSSRFGSVISGIRNRAHEFFVSILYSQSKGVLLAERLTAADKTSFSQNLLNTLDHVTPDQSVMQKLPHYYTMLFSGRSSISDNFWVTRVEEESELRSALNRYQSGMPGLMVVLGERNAGKTALCKYFCEKNFSDERVYHVFSRDAGSADPEQFSMALQKATRIEGNPDEVLNSLVHGAVIVIHDMELWWERNGEDGLKTIRLIKQLVDSHSRKCLFIVNMNPFAYEVLNSVESLDTYSLGTIRCRPFNAYELRQLILTRHHSSGIRFVLGKNEESEVGEITLARVFNKVFEYSHGNPGMAMNAWLCGIVRYQNMVITIKMPRLPDTRVLANFPTSWNMICLQLLMHKRMTWDKMLRVLSEKPENVAEPLRAMARLGVIKTNNLEIYGLNPYIEFLMIKVFHEKEWI